jgi:hypothetical protein
VTLFGFAMATVGFNVPAASKVALCRVHGLQAIDEGVRKPPKALQVSPLNVGNSYTKHGARETSLNGYDKENLHQHLSEILAIHSQAVVRILLSKILTSTLA